MSVAIRNILGRTIVFWTTNYGAQAKVISSNETLMVCVCMKNFGNSKWDVDFLTSNFDCKKNSLVRPNKFHWSKLQYLISNHEKHYLEEASHRAPNLYWQPDWKINLIDFFDKFCSINPIHLESWSCFVCGKCVVILWQKLGQIQSVGCSICDDD